MEKQEVNNMIKEMGELSENKEANKARLVELAKALTTHYMWEDKKVDKSQLEIPFEEQ